MQVPEPGPRSRPEGRRRQLTGSGEHSCQPRHQKESDKEEEPRRGGTKTSPPAARDRNAVRPGWQLARAWGLRPSRQQVGTRGPRAQGRPCWSDTYLRVRAAAPERGLVHRRRLQPSASRRGCCSAAAAAPSPARPEPGFPPPPRAGRPVGRGNPALLRGERRQRRLLHVSPGCPVSQQFPPGPQRRLRRCCHRLSHIPSLRRSRRRRRAATTDPGAGARCSTASPRPAGQARPGPGRPRRGCREAAAAPSPQSTARLRRGGRAGARPGRGERRHRGRRASARAAARRGRSRPPGAGSTPRGSPVGTLIALQAETETLTELRRPHDPPPPRAVLGSPRGRLPPSAGLGRDSSARPSPTLHTNRLQTSLSHPNTF